MKPNLHCRAFRREQPKAYRARPRPARARRSRILTPARYAHMTTTCETDPKVSGVRTVAASVGTKALLDPFATGAGSMRGWRDMNPRKLPRLIILTAGYALLVL